MSRWRLVLIMCIVTCYNNNTAECCSERECASIVSKCLLAQSCKCAKNDYYCYQQCRQCLGEHYYEACCDCVEMCAEHKQQQKAHSSLSSKSHVEDFDGLPELYNALVAHVDGEIAGQYDDDENQWRQYTYAVEFNSHKRHMNTINKVHKQSHELDDITLNCTVIYLHQCTSWNKCRHSCRAIGASSYRWFHDGCCECIGPTCVNYGINESRCKYCPHPDDLFDDDEEHNEEDNEIQII